MNKKNLLLVGLLAVSGITFSAEQEFNTDNEEICIYDNITPLCFAASTTLAIGLLTELAVSGIYWASNRFEAELALAGGGIVLVGYGLMNIYLKNRGHLKPKIVLNKKGFSYQNAFYSWEAIKEIEWRKNWVGDFIAFKAYFKNATEITILINDKQESSQEIKRLVEHFYLASQENKQ